MKKPAFTLPEIFIAIGIIGIIAAMTIPNFIYKMTERDLVSSYLKTHEVLTNAYKETESVKGFKLYNIAPDKFKEYFEEHLKLLGENTCEHDVCLMDSSYLDYECSETECTYITVDTNGEKKPNQIGKDIYKFKITKAGLISEGEREICTGYDCGNYVISHHKIFNGLLEGCDEYGEDGRCTECTDGYRLNNGLCNGVNTPNCKKYSGEDCIECKDKYLLTNTETVCTSMESLNCKETEDGETCSKCKAMYRNDGGVCTEVPPVEGCDNSYEEDKCTSCQGGYMLSDGTCSPCPKGTYAVAGSDTCTSCPKGTSSGTEKATSSAACTSCGAGTYSADAGAESCTSCSAGTYTSSASSTSCSVCTGNTISAEGASGCTSCGSGNVSQNGHTSCAAQYYCNSGTLTPTSHQCYTITGASNCIAVSSSCPSGMHFASAAEVNSLTGELKTSWNVWTNDVYNGQCAAIISLNGVQTAGVWAAPYAANLSGICVGNSQQRTNQ